MGFSSDLKAFERRTFISWESESTTLKPMRGGLKDSIMRASESMPPLSLAMTMMIHRSLMSFWSLLSGTELKGPSFPSSPLFQGLGSIRG